jgi:hypothetical protein
VGLPLRNVTLPVTAGVAWLTLLARWWIDAGQLVDRRQRGPIGGIPTVRCAAPREVWEMLAAGLIYRRSLQVEHMRCDVAVVS